MSKTSIEWTDRSWNPIVGCSLASPGCTNCYAMRTARRLAANPATPHYAGTVQTVKGKPVWTGKVAMASDRVLLEPLRRKKPTTYFVNSMGDLFHENVPDEWIDRVFAVMALCPQHTFQVLTKRAARMRNYVSTTNDAWHGNADLFADRFQAAMDWNYAWIDDIDAMQWPLPNVWLGVSAEDQQRADDRIPDLLATPAAVRFVSIEPMLGPVDLSSINLPNGDILNALTGEVHDPTTGCIVREIETLGWAIVGGESGPGARPMHPDWPRAIRDQCKAAGVPFFFKQWGEWLPWEWGSPPDMESQNGGWMDANCIPDLEDVYVAKNWSDACLYDGDDGCIHERVGKAAAGHLLDGVEHRDFPKGVS